MDILYNDIKLYKNNLYLETDKVQITPKIIFNLNPDKFYTLIVFDPEAVGGNKIHWLVINITNNNINNGKTLIKYKGPAPPKGSGTHHYVFCLLEYDLPIDISKINIQGSFKSRFIELDKLFKIINLRKDKSKIKIIKYFLSSNDFN
jgi:phosphatidylethanolamine-binding protein (PEBP) family uncharacterized protein